VVRAALAVGYTMLRDDGYRMLFGVTHSQILRIPTPVPTKITNTNMTITNMTTMTDMTINTNITGNRTY
jgi:hypothetical protein